VMATARGLGFRCNFTIVAATAFTGLGASCYLDVAAQPDARSASTQPWRRCSDLRQAATLCRKRERPLRCRSRCCLRRRNPRVTRSTPCWTEMPEPLLPVMLPEKRRTVEFRSAKMPPQVGSVGHAEPLFWMMCGPPASTTTLCLARTIPSTFILVQIKNMRS
jgi:hypothetical protein